MFVSKIYWDCCAGRYVIRSHYFTLIIFCMFSLSVWFFLCYVSPFRLPAGHEQGPWCLVHKEGSTNEYSLVPLLKMPPSQSGRWFKYQQRSCVWTYISANTKGQIQSWSHFVEILRKQSVLMDREIFFFRLQKLTRDSCLVHLKLMKTNRKNQEAL